VLTIDKLVDFTTKKTYISLLNSCQVYSKDWLYMKLVESLASIDKPFANAVVTIGNFDGVHKGHQALLGKVIDKAKEINGTSVAITFEPHPLRVLKNVSHPPLITIYEQKIELLEKTGIDVLISIPFTKEFGEISANSFIEDLLVKTIGMKAIVVGQDYSFGKNRAGNIDLLKTSATEYGYELIIPEWITAPNAEERVSSTIIREIISAGEVEKAPALLGRYYQVRGQVVSGRDRGGKLLGFPTANLNLYDELCPKTGVYAVTVETDDGNYNGVANLGYSPTFDDHLFTVEVHILNFNADIYNQNIRVNLVSKLRDEKKFSGIEELSEQIEKDIQTARKVLGD